MCCDVRYIQKWPKTKKNKKTFLLTIEDGKTLI